MTSVLVAPPFDEVSPKSVTLTPSESYVVTNVGEVVAYVRPVGASATGSYVRLGRNETTLVTHSEDITSLDFYPLPDARYVSGADIYYRPAKLEILELDDAAGSPDTGWTRDDIVPGAGDLVDRRGAEITSGASRVLTSWAPSTSSAVEIEVIYAAYPKSGISRIAGAPVTGHLYLWRDGTRLFLGNGEATIETLNDAIEEDGRARHFRFGYQGGELYLFKDGVQLSSRTLAFNLGTTATNYYLGDTQSAENATGAYVDWRLTDPASETNTAYYPLDTLNANGDYPNEYPDSNVGDATVVGTVLPVEVNSVTPGSGVPVPVGPVVVHSASTTVASHSGASGSTDFLGLSGTIDPYGWISGGGLNSTLAGPAVIEFTGRIRATALSGSDDVTIEVPFPGIAIGRQELTLDTVGEWVPFAITFAASDTSTSPFVTPKVLGIAATTDIETDDRHLTLTLYPDLS